MKSHRLIPFIASALLVCDAGCSSENSSKIKSTAETNVVFSDSTLQVGEATHRFPLTVGTLIGIFGKPDETHELYTTIRVWNRLGIYCYTDTGSDVITDLTVTFVKGPYDFSPTQPFEGKLTIGDVVLTNVTTEKSLLSLDFEPKPASGKPGVTKKAGAHSVIVDTVDGKAAAVSIHLPAKAQKAAP